MHVYCNGKTFSLDDIEMLLFSKRSLFLKQYNKNKRSLELGVSVTWDLPIKSYSTKQSFHLVMSLGKND